MADSEKPWRYKMKPVEESEDQDKPKKDPYKSVEVVLSIVGIIVGLVVLAVVGFVVYVWIVCGGGH